MATRTRRRWLLAAACGLLGMLPYLNSLRGGFTFDDYGFAVLNPFLPAEAPMLAAFAGPSTSGSMYRPLTMVSYLCNHRLGGTPFGFHLANVLLFGASTALVFLLAEAVSASLAVALATALVWAVHPIHTEAVASVAGRGEILAAAFLFVALLAVLRGLRDDTHRLAWRAVSLAAFAAALLSKESAAAGMLLVPLVAWWCAPRRPLRDLVRLTAPYAAAVAALVAVRTVAVGALTQAEIPFVDNPLAYVGTGPRLATALVVLWQYVGLLALPFGLSADYSYDQVPVVTSPADPRFVVAVIGLLGLVLIAWVARREAPLLTLGELFAAGALVVTANVVAPIGTIKAERLLFLPSFGWCLACGWALVAWIGRPVDHRRLAVAGIVLALLALGTWTRNVDWRDDFTLLNVTAAASPRSVRALTNAGAARGQAGDLAAAERFFRRAIAIDPTYRAAWRQLSLVLRLQGRDAESAEAAGRAQQLAAASRRPGP